MLLQISAAVAWTSVMSALAAAGSLAVALIIFWGARRAQIPQLAVAIDEPTLKDELIIALEHLAGDPAQEVTVIAAVLNEWMYSRPGSGLMREGDAWKIESTIFYNVGSSDQLHGIVVYRDRLGHVRARTLDGRSRMWRAGRIVGLASRHPSERRLLWRTRRFLAPVPDTVGARLAAALLSVAGQDTGDLIREQRNVLRRVLETHPETGEPFWRFKALFRRIPPRVEAKDAFRVFYPAVKLELEDRNVAATRRNRP